VEGTGKGNVFNEKPADKRDNGKNKGGKGTIHRNVFSDWKEEGEFPIVEIDRVLRSGEWSVVGKGEFVALKHADRSQSPLGV